MLHAYAHKFAVLMIREQAAPAIASWCSSFSAHNFPTSVLLQEQRNEQRPPLHMYKEDNISQVQILLIY